MTRPPDTYILLRSPVPGGGYTLVYHPGQPADYTGPDGVTWQNSRAWHRHEGDDLRVYGPRVVLTYMALVRATDLVRETWPSAMPINLDLAEAVGKPLGYQPSEPPTPRHIDVLMHAAPRPLDRGGRGCRRRPGSVRRAGAGDEAGARPGPPQYPDHPR